MDDNFGNDYFGHTVGFGSASPSSWGTPPPAPVGPAANPRPAEELPFAPPQQQGWPPYPAQQAYPAAPAYVAPPQGMSTAVKVLIGVAIAFGGLVVLGILAAIAIPAFLDHRESQLVARTTVSIPESVAGLPRMFGPEATRIEGVLTNVPGAGEHLAGVYGTSAPTLAVSVTKQHMTALQRRGFMWGVEKGAGVPLKSTDPGPLGGELRCAAASNGYTLCAFIDVAAYGSVIVYGGTDPQGQARQARAAVEHRS